MRNRYPGLILLSTVLVSGFSTAFTRENTLNGSLGQVQIEAEEPDENAVRTVSTLIFSHPQTQERLKNVRWRTLASQVSSSGYIFLVYDYTHDRLIQITGDLKSSGPSRFRILKGQDAPGPSPEELDEARSILASDHRFTGGLRSDQWQTYPALPSLIHLKDSHERVVAIGLRPIRSGARHEIVGVSLSRARVIRFPIGYPASSLAEPTAPASATILQPPTGRGLPGTTLLNIQKGGEILWKMSLTRPSSSSGKLGSGIDLKNISYKGRSAFSRINTSRITVRYANDRCGPYRVRQYAESAYRIDGSDLAPGLRTSQLSTTAAFDSGTGVGNFRGVAVHTEGDTTSFFTEIEEGWFHYFIEYRFHDDGRIEPRIRVSSTFNSCSTVQHRHELVWQVDDQEHVFSVEDDEPATGPILTAWFPRPDDLIPDRILITKLKSESL